MQNFAAALGFAVLRLDQNIGFLSNRKAPIHSLTMGKGCLYFYAPFNQFECDVGISLWYISVCAEVSVCIRTVQARVLGFQNCLSYTHFS